MRLFKIKCMTLLLLLGASGITHAQETTDQSVEAPAWMSELYTESVQGTRYQDWVTRYQTFRESLPNGGKKTPYNKYIINGFRSWQKHITQFVDADGIIRLPSVSEYQETMKKINAPKMQKTRGTGSSLQVEPWTVLAPMVSYNYQSKKASAWQSNIFRFAVSPHDKNVLYCGSETGMIFKTTDKGLNWTACAPLHHFGYEVYALDISRQNPNKVLAAVGTNLWLSTDGGDNWTDITPNYGSYAKAFNYIRDAVFQPNNDNVIIVGTEVGIYKSSNGGSSFTRLVGGRCMDLQYSKHASNPVLYALHSQNNTGMDLVKFTTENYQSTRIKFNDVNFTAGRIAVTPANAEIVYVLGLNGYDYIHPFFRGKPVLMYSEDMGSNWTRRNVYEHMNSMDKDGGQGYYDLVLGVHRENPQKVFMGVLYLYSSSDGGQTLDQHSMYYDKNQKGPEIGGYFGKYDMHTDMQQIYLDDETNEMWLSTDGGLFYSADLFETEPEARNRGIYASEFWGFDQGWNEDIIVGGRNHNGDMVRMASYGDVSVTLGGSENPTGYVFMSNPKKVTFFDTKQKFVVPENWQNPFVEFPNAAHFNVWPKEDVTYGTPMEFHPHYATNYLIVTSDHFGKPDATYKMLWRTQDDGLSYTLLHTFNENITAYTVSRSNPNKIVVGTVTKMYYSEDGGNIFQEYNLPDGLKKAAYYKIAIHPTRDNEIWVNTHLQGGMFRTTDNGVTWEQINAGLEIAGTSKMHYLTQFFLTGNEKDAVYAIANVDFQMARDTYAGAGRVYYWDTEQNAWSNISEGLPNQMRINRMLPFYKDGKVRIATDNGVWQMPLIDSNPAPIATPMILNAGSGQWPVPTTLQFDSYSIVNQNGAQWEWTFEPAPVSISNRYARNPVVQIAPNQSYNVTLKVTNSLGQSHTTTVREMIKGENEVPTGVTSVSSNELVRLQTTLLEKGEALAFLCNQQVDNPLTIEIYNANGALLHREQSTQPSRIVWGTHPSGIYFYQVKDKGYRKMGKFMVK